MEQLNINHILDRDAGETKLIECLDYFEKNKNALLTKRGVYIYGAPGSGKTFFVRHVLKKLDYDIISYDAGDIRNKSIIEMITKHNMSDKNILSLFYKKIKKIAIIMDEIDGMNSGDKGGINALIKLIRPKKTKKQKKENTTMIPIICIGNYHIDKKIKELMKVCNVIELKIPTPPQMTNILQILMPKLDQSLWKDLVTFFQGDLRKLDSTYNIYKKQQDILKNKIIQNIFHQIVLNEDTKQITHKLLNNFFTIDQHSMVMNETDRTSVALLFHENIIDVLEYFPKEIGINFYINILNNICFADYIDRITFQKQIWVFNEMSSLIKTFYNHRLFHKKNETYKIKFNPPEVRFTKILTKYSTEYNNMLFIHKLCTQLSMDKKDLYAFFLNLRNKYEYDEIYELFNDDCHEITKLDINRIYRYIDYFTGKTGI
jgi:hypothetical protein